MDLHIFNIWSADRKIKNVFMCNASLEAVIKKAQSFNMQGTKLVVESNGSVICEDAFLEYYVKHKSDFMIFMLLNEGDEWIPVQLETKVTPSTSTEDTQIPIQFSINDSISGISENFENEYVVLTEKENISCSSQAASLDTTLSMSSTALSSRSESYTQVSRTFSQFKIPWSKMPYDVLEILEKKQLLNKRLTALANVIVDELRAFSYYIPMSVFRSVAQQAADQYPESIIERDEEGHFISSEPLALITKMKNRNNTLNRAPKRKIPDVNLKIPLKARRTATVLQKSCTNWQPSENKFDSSAVSVQFKKKFLLEMYQKKEITAENRKKIEQYMKDTFPEQRLFLNNSENVPDINTIKTNWPYLFDKDIVKGHFIALMDKDPANIKINFDANKERIKLFLQNSKNKDITRLDLETDETIIINLTKYFKKDVDFIFKRFEFGTSLNTVKDRIPTNGPWAGIVQTTQDGDALIYIFIEKVEVHVFEFINSDIIGMLELLICYYYMLNIMYPKEISQFMEFSVRYFLKHYSDGVRGSKKSLNNLNKINTLIIKLATI